MGLCTQESANGRTAGGAYRTGRDGGRGRRAGGSEPGGAGVARRGVGAEGRRRGGARGVARGGSVRGPGRAERVRGLGRWRVTTMLGGTCEREALQSALR
jgi:hypothetical protein